MLPSWIRSRNCRPRLVYFLAIEITRRRFASTISFLAWRASRSPFCTMWTILRNSPISRPGLGRQRLDVGADLLDAVLVVRDEVLPALGRELRDAVEPLRVQLLALVVAQEVLARHAIAFGEPHQAALVGHEALVDVVELLDQRVDARLVEAQRLHLGDEVFLDLLVLALLRGRERLVLQLVRDVLVLQAAQPLVLVGDLVEGLEHLRLQLGLDRGERQRILHVVVVQVGFADRRALAFLGRAVGAVRRAAAAGSSPAARDGTGSRPAAPTAAPRPRPGPPGGRRPAAAGAPAAAGFGHALHGVGARIGRFQVDDVAQEDLSFVQLVAPDDDRLEGERALAQAGDHRLAAGLDALGDRDLALAREQLDRAHLAQIHAHRIVGALARLGLLRLGDGLLRDLDQVAAGIIVVVVVLFLLVLARPPRTRRR